MECTVLGRNGLINGIEHAGGDYDVRSIVGNRQSDKLLQDMSFNANGGIQFMKANKIEEAYVVIGNVASTGGEVSLSAFTGGTPGAMGAYMTYETL